MRTLLWLVVCFGAGISASAEDYLLHSFKTQQLDQHFWSEGATLGDFNRDGKMDVVSGPFWYAGPEFKQRQEIYEPKVSFKTKKADGGDVTIPGFEGALGVKNTYSDNFFAFTHDFNNDGWTDILIYGFPGQDASWYANPQGKVGHWTRHKVFNNVDNESPTWGDITGDGKPEIICHSDGFLGYVSPDWADATKPWTFHKISAKGPWQRFTHGLGFGDVNGDGRADFLLGSGWWEQPESLVGDPEWKQHPAPFGNGAQMYVYDVNGDGLNDVVTSLQAHGYGLAWFEQYDDAGTKKFRQQLIMGGEVNQNRYGLKFAQLHAVELIDMDGDGLKDIVTGKRFWAHGAKGDAEPDAPPVVYWFKLVRNADKSVDWVPQFVDDNSGVGTQVVVGDLNGDKLPDIIVGNKKGTFISLHETKKVSKDEWEKAQPKPRAVVAPVPKTTSATGAGGNSVAERLSYAKRDASVFALGQLPIGRDGKPLNTDFETGDLRDWTATGDAFKKQPIKGDVVNARRADSHSQHAGEFWIAGYEVVQDFGLGTLTSAPFRVTQPWAAFLVAGGGYDNCRVELVRADNNEVVFRTTVFEPDVFQARNNAQENLRPCVVDLSAQMGRELFIRLVDQQQGHWAHLNFDDFKLYAKRPEFTVEFKAVAQGLKQLGPAQPAPVAPVDQLKFAGLSPVEAAKAMTVPDGFKVTLFAGEPDVVQPIAMALDDRGRLWVAEAYSYPARVPDEQAKDRILILEDTDNDGRFDKRKVFIDKLNLVSGMELGFGGVWVGAAPHFLFIADKDGDDVPDSEPQILLDGWGSQDTHETLNSFIWGPDGWLYGCHGVFTHSRVGKPGTPDEQRIPINAGIWRYHPVRHQFEVFAQGTSNPWGVDFNDRGQAFATACVIPHLYHVIHNGRYQRQAGTHFNPYTYDDIKTIAVHRHYVGGTAHGGNGRSDSAGGGHAHAGAMIYLGGSWPEKYRDQIFMNNIHGARLNQDALSTNGSGYAGNRAPDFLLSNDVWSQILYLTYGPDGSVYMIDWYDKNQCHHGNSAGHDRTNGRVFKISYAGAKTDASSPTLGSLQGDLKKLSNEQLVGLQTHRNDWFVRHARRILQERAAELAAQKLAAKEQPAAKAPASMPYDELWKLAFEGDNETQQLRGLWALHATGGLKKAIVSVALNNKSPFVRAWTIQLSCEQYTPTPAILTRFIELAKDDPSPVVRLYLASVAQRLPIEMRAAIVGQLVAHAEDAGDHNLPLMYWYAAESLVSARPDDAIDVLSRSKLPLVSSFLVRRLAQTGDPLVLDKLIQGTLGADSNVAQQRLALREINEGLKGRRKVEMPASWTTTFAALSRSADADVRSQSMSLAITFGDPLAVEVQRGILSDSKAAPAARLDAMQALVKITAPNLAPLLQGLVSDETLGGPAIRALAAYDDAKTPAALLAVFEKLSSETKRDALSTLASRPAYADSLLAAVEAKQLAATSLTADIITQLRNLKNEKLNDRIGKVWGTVRDTPEDKLLEIERLKKLLTARPKAEHAPDIALGRAVFVKTCQNCHTLFGVGHKIGPDITGSNRANLDYLLSNMVDPSALVGKDYQAHIVTTKAGRVLTGLIKVEDEQSLTLATATESVVIPKNEIEDRLLSPKSMMPDGQLLPMTEKELRSLVAYLASPTQTQLLGTADTIKTFFNGKDLSGWSGSPSLWSVENGELVGRTPGLKHNEFLKSDLVLGDFRFAVDVLLVKNEGNSGIQFRSEVTPTGDMKGYQADVGVGWWGKLYEEHGRALLWDKSGEQHVKPGEWTHYEIEAVGGRVRTWLNGQLCVDLDDAAGAKSGVIGLQLHSGGATEVRYKGFELKLVAP